MKKEFPIIMSILVITSFSCNSQSKNDAVKQATHIQKAVKENSPGYMSTNAEYYFKAKINGKDWIADEVMASDRAGRIIGQTKEGESISLPFELRYTKSGAKTDFAHHASDIYMKDDVGIWGGTKGQMEFTNVSDKYAEGKFFVTATSTGSDKALTITEGTFRIPLTD